METLKNILSWIIATAVVVTLAIALLCQIKEAQHLRGVIIRIEGESLLKTIPTSEQLQESLQEAGYYSGKIDGRFGPESRAAWDNWENDYLNEKIRNYAGGTR